LHERLEHLDLFVIDEVHALDAEAANFFLRKYWRLPPRRGPPVRHRPGHRAPAFAALASPSSTGVTFTALATTAGMPFGAV